MYRVSGEVQERPPIGSPESDAYRNQAVEPSQVVTCHLSVRHLPFYMPRVGTSPPNVVKRIGNRTKVQILVVQIQSSTHSKDFSSCSQKKDTAAFLLRIMAVYHKCLSKSFE